MKKILLLYAFVISIGIGYGQSSIDLSFDGAQDNIEDPFFNDADNSPWEISHGSPNVQFVIGEKVIELYSAVGMEGCRDEFGNYYPSNEAGSEGIYFKYNFKKGQHYVLSGRFLVLNNADEFGIYLANGLVKPSSDQTNDPLDCEADNTPPDVPHREYDPITASNDWQELMYGTNYYSDGGQMEDFSICFVPDKDYSQLWFSLFDDDVIYTSIDVADDIASFKFGELTLNCHSEDEIVITNTEGRYAEAPYYIHNMMRPVNVANKITINPGPPFGITVKQKDAPVNLFGTEEIVIEATNPDFEFVVEPHVQPGVSAFEASIGEIDDVCLAINECDNYFNLQQMSIISEADFVNGWYGDANGNLSFGNEVDEYNGVPLVEHPTINNCLVVPEIISVGHVSPHHGTYYARWYPRAVGYPMSYNAIKYKFTVFNSSSVTYYEEEDVNCYGFEPDRIYYDGKKGWDLTTETHVIMLTELENCISDRTFSMNLYVGYAGFQDNGNLSFSVPNMDDSHLYDLHFTPKSSENTFLNSDMSRSSSPLSFVEKFSSGSKYSARERNPISPNYPAPEKTKTSQFEKNVGNGIKAYLTPNPSQEITTLHYTLNQSGIASISLQDTKGKIVQQILPNTEHSRGDFKVPINIAMLPNGLYFCVIQINGLRVIKKLIKQ